MTKEREINIDGNLSETLERSDNAEVEMKDSVSNESEQNQNDDSVASNSEVSEQSLDESTNDSVGSELERAKQEIAGLKEGVLRARAEAENIRRRVENDVIAARKYGIENFAKLLLDVKDSLDQATMVDLNQSAESSVIDQMRDGLSLTLKLLDSAMERFAIREINPEPGEEFNPDFHQAISMQASEEINSNCIVNVVQKGFVLHDRLLRPAMVIVAEKK